MRLIAKKLIPFLLVFSMVITLVPVFALPVFAAAAEEEEEEGFQISQDYTSVVYNNIDEKLASMGKGEDGLPNGMPVLTRYGYELYYQYETGEIAIKDLRTNQVLTSNPYDVGYTGPTPNIKNELLSQIMISYMDADKTQYFNSYQQAALNGQIKMKPIKGGIRVEYTIGKEEKRKLVPRMISAESFEANIMAYVPEGRARDKLNAYYSYKDATAPDLTERAKRELQVKFPITSRFAIYVFDPNASARELTEIEKYIKDYTQYTFEMMDEDHRNTDWTGTDKAPALFKMALEYYIEEDGLKVRLPANGIRYDESTYKITEINVLPFMGAIRRENIGYTFIPDGSGSLVRSEDIKDKQFTMTNSLYGSDYSFFKINTQSWTKKWRMPVYGAVEEYTISRTFTEEVEEEVEVPAVMGVDEAGNEIEVTPATTQMVTKQESRVEKESRRDGFLAIIEEGDAMAQISTKHAGPVHKYNSVSSMFTPRPTDDYSLDMTSTGLSSMITVASRRKYAGNYIIKYVMLSDNVNPEYKGDNKEVHEATWVGMAKAYREYLEEKGGLARLTDTGGDIPVYLETLGLMQSAEYFLGFPYEAQTPLTSFENVKSMIDDLNAEGISNLNFRMRGWNNGGMIHTIPTKIKIHRTMGGANGLRDLMEYAGSKGATVYPDVEISLFMGASSFSGFNYKKDAARAMNDMYSWEQQYWFLIQGFEFWYHNVVAPSRLNRIYDLAMRDYSKYNAHAMSVASMSRELHSDQNKRNLTNRQEAKDYVLEVLGKAKEDNGKLLGEEANAYAWQYLDATLNVALESSRRMDQSESVPFYGMVTHGYIDTAGLPINMSGDIQYEILKAIENGSNPYFILTYQNTNKLKEWDMLAVYYSVDYKTWFPEIVKIYNLMNDALKDVRYKLIVDHEFLATNIVKVTYEGGTSFILNYNNEVVEAEGHTLGPLEFVKIN